MEKKPLLHLNIWILPLPQLSARVRNLQAGLSGATVLAAGPGISLKHKVENSYQGSDSNGTFVAARATQAPGQMPAADHPQQSQPAALCTAVFDFHPAEIDLEDSESFLSFRKV